MKRIIEIMLLLLYEALILFAIVKYPESKAFELGVIVFLTLITFNTLKHGPE